jgi:hypothetical protein
MKNFKETLIKLNNHKFFIFLLVFLISTIHPLNIYADSGACSDHQGVDCAIGPDIHGNVVCNDGWTNSSVSYTSMNECYQPSSCPVYYPQSDYTTQLNDYNEIINQAQQQMQADDKEAQDLCISNATSSYQLAQTNYKNCTEYQAGLQLMYVQQNTGMPNQSQGIASCGQSPTLSSSTCANLTGPDDIQYLELIQNAKHDISCLKILPVPKSDADIKAEIDTIATNIKNNSSEKNNNTGTTNNSTTATPKDSSGSKALSNFTLNIPVASSPKHIVSIFSSSSTKTIPVTPSIQSPPTSSVSTPVVKIGFWSKVKNFFKSLF